MIIQAISHTSVEQLNEDPKVSQFSLFWGGREDAPTVSIIQAVTGQTSEQRKQRKKMFISILSFNMYLAYIKRVMALSSFKFLFGIDEFLPMAPIQ